MTLDEPLALSKPRFLLLEKMREIIQTSQEWRGLNNFMQLSATCLAHNGC